LDHSSQPIDLLVFHVVPLGRVNWRGDCYNSYAMRYLCVLLILALSLPAATQARTVSVKVGKTTKLSPQQVQFMRWWRAQNIRVVRPAAKPAVKPIAQTKLTLKVVPRSVTGRTVKVVRINTNTRRQVRVPINRKTATQRTRTPSLLTLKAILINARKAARVPRLWAVRLILPLPKRRTMSSRSTPSGSTLQ
jgi:hypothetical protein